MYTRRLIFFCCFFVFYAEAQVSEQYIFDNLEQYSPSTFYLISTYKKSGPSISYGGRTVTVGMKHLEFCDLSTKERFLSTISTTVHETVHAFDSHLPLMQAKQLGEDPRISDDEGFFIDESIKLVYKFPKNKLFSARFLSETIPVNLRTCRYNSYIETKHFNQSTQVDGIVGLMEEFNAYYHGAKVIYDFLPLFRETYGDNFLWHWSSGFTSNADAFYEFDFFIKEYLLYAKKHYPALYLELKNDANFKTIYKTIRTKFSLMIAAYEKKYDEFTLTAKKGTGLVFSSEKHSSLIFPILSGQIKSNRYEEINENFLSH
ncbi:MAG: hypothetical protein FJZ66_04530 [Bacteroidetes bacterium]|nr:hypothetical protein [Bacteroidota bacterium]